jgi:hypothetical protein
MPSAKKKVQLTEASMKQLKHASNASGKYIVRDTELAGFMVLVGVNTKSFRLETERREAGKRVSISRRLGEWPAMTVQEARVAVASAMGERADGKAALGPRQVVTVAQAMESYLEHLEGVAKRAGKADASKSGKGNWRDRVANMNEKHIKPAFGHRSLKWLVENPEAVREWHKSIAERSPSVANKVATILGLAYTHACKFIRECRTLPRDHSPNEMVDPAKELKRRIALAFADFPKWFAEVARIPSETRRCFHMLNLLLGTRPGELGRTLICSWDRSKGHLTLLKTKSGGNIVLPTSPQIDYWLDRALVEAHRRDPNGEYLFPSRGSFTRRFDGDVTPYGHALRRTYKTLAAELLVPDKISASLLGHSVGGMSQIYIVESVLIGGVSVPAAQRKISEGMYGLFGERAALAAPSFNFTISTPLATKSLVDAG